jgi:ribosome-associated translation inhibitor RaiA
MYDKIDALANKLEEIVTKMKTHAARHHQEVDLESIQLLALAKTQRRSEKRNSKQT